MSTRDCYHDLEEMLSMNAVSLRVSTCMRKIIELQAFVFLPLFLSWFLRGVIGPPSKTASLTGPGYVNAITTNTVSICLA